MYHGLSKCFFCQLQKQETFSNNNYEDNLMIRFVGALSNRNSENISCPEPVDTKNYRFF